MASVFTLIRTVPNTRDIGRMIYSMATARNLGRMALNTRVNTATAKSMDRDITSGTTARNMMASGLITKLKVMVFTNGKTGVYLQVTG